MSDATKIEYQTAKEVFKAHEQFVRCMLDAWCVVDETGKVVKSNLLFSVLTGESSKKILKADSFDSLLSLSIAGKKLSIQNILAEVNPTRIDEVSGTKSNEGGTKPLMVMVGIFPLIDENANKHVGSFILLRDVTDESALHNIYTETKTDSITDKLTGLFTRRYFEDYFENLPDQQDDKEKEDISLIMVDIDFFKKVNDVYGHQAGDYVLAKTGEIMSTAFRKTDKACRYGGEEFLVILPDTPTKGAVKAAESLRKKIQDTVFSFQNQRIPVTISCGVSTMLSMSEEPYEETMKRADQSLYKAKEDGRNRVYSLQGGKLELGTDTNKSDYFIKT